MQHFWIFGLAFYGLKTIIVEIIIAVTDIWRIYHG